MGRHPSGNTPPQQLLRVESKHREIMRRLIAGESNKKIATDLGMSETRLSIVRNSPLFLKEYKNLEAEVKSRFLDSAAKIQEKINNLQEPAIDMLGKILTEKSVDDMRVTPILKHQVALDILDLGGNGKKRIENNKNDAINDVIKVISDGFELAKQAMSEKLSHNDNNIKDNIKEKNVEDIEFEDITSQNLLEDDKQLANII